MINANAEIVKNAEALGFKHKYLKDTPTLSEVSDWFRETYDINIRVGCSSLTAYFPVVEHLEEDGTTLMGNRYVGMVKTYDAALEQGLTDALTELVEAKGLLEKLP